MAEEFEKKPKDEMDAVPLTDERKETFAEQAADAAEKKHAASRRGHVGRIAAAAVSAAVLLGGLGTVAYAGLRHISVGQAVTDIFTGAPAPTEIVDKVGHPVNATATNAGITLTADAVAGDERNVAVVYSVEKTDGTPFGEIGKTDNGILTLDGNLMTANLDEQIDGTHGISGSLWMYDADPNDNALQIVVLATSDEPIDGHRVQTHMSGLAVYDTQTQQKTVVFPGSWDLKFDLAYTPDTVQKTPHGSFSLNGTPIDVRSVSVSPVGITIEYAAAGTEQAPDNGQWAPKMLDLGTVEVTKTDGTSFTRKAGGGFSDIQDGTTVCTVGTFFPQIVDPADIASISFCGGTAS